MIYKELELNMSLLCHRSDGSKKILKVVRKGVDGFGKESAVFGSTISLAQFYCPAEHVPLWYIEPAKTIRLISVNVEGMELDRTFNFTDLENSFRGECMCVPPNDDEIKLVEINGTNVTDSIKKGNRTFDDVAAYLGWTQSR